MNREYHIIRQVEQDNPSIFVAEQKEKEGTLTEITMSDIAKKLRSVYAQMQRKHSLRPLTSQSSVEEGFKSYLDDISRAILAEHYIRRQKEKKLFEYLEQIKMLVQNLQNEKKNLEEAVIKQQMSRSKSLDSVVQKLADMTCEGNEKRSLLQEVPKFSRQKRTTPSQINAGNLLQKKSKSSLPSHIIKSSSKETEKTMGHFVREEECSDVRESGQYIENDASLSFNMESQGIFFLSRSPVKIFFWCFLIIAFIMPITLSF